MDNEHGRSWLWTCSASRALFMLIGGALMDRFSPRTVVIASNIGRMALVALMPLFGSTAAVAATTLLIGMANGYVNINFFTWLQKRIPQELMGRMMSLLIVFSLGLAPVSNVVAGAILQINLNVLFIGGGLLMAALSLLAVVLPEIRRMGLEPLAASQPA